MKDNKGVTLVVLVVIIVLIVIFSSAAIYTSVNSYKLIGLQKYKAQMQAIQSGLDEFYEEFENMYEKNERRLKELTGEDGKELNLINNKQDFMQYYIKYIYNSEEGEISEFVLDIYNGIKTSNIKNYYEKNDYDYDEWWKKTANEFGISTIEESIKKQYYYLSKDEIESLLGVKDIDISENFIINFEKRYVFSETPIEITYEEDNGTEEKEEKEKNIYCLYQLNEEEKIVEFKAENTGGMLDIAITEKTLNYQTIRIKLIGQESTIKKVYIISDNSEKAVLVEEDKEHVQEVTGLETNEVCVKIKKDGQYIFGAEDLLEGIYSSESSVNVKLHQPPVLEDNMIPFVANGEKEGIIFYDNGEKNLNEWYDYYFDNESNFPNKYATVVIAANNEYKKDNHGKTFEIKQGTEQYEDNTHIVKVWIPKNLYKKMNETKNYSSTEFINKSGIWVVAKWDDSKKQWVPNNTEVPLGKFAKVNSSENSISFTFEIPKKEGNDEYTLYYYTDDYGWKKYEAGNKITFSEDNNNIKTKIKYYTIDKTGKKSKVISKTPQKVKVENLLKNSGYNDEYYKIEGNPERDEWFYWYKGIYYNCKHKYYARYDTIFSGTSGCTTEVFLPEIDGGSFGCQELIEGEKTYHFYRVTNPLYTTNHNFRIDFNNNKNVGTLKIRKPMLVDVSEIYGEGNEPTQTNGVTFDYTYDYSYQWIIK